MKKLSLKSGAIIPALLMLPNVAWMLFYSLDAGEKNAVPLPLSIAENVTRSIALALPIFNSLNLKRAWSKAVLIGMAIALALYYLAWARFFMGGGAAELLSAPLLAIPSPLALAPVALLLLSSYLMNSWLMFSAASCFGVLHVWVLSVSGQ
jgi:Flp pilus assembly protein protease CpaA